MKAGEKVLFAWPDGETTPCTVHSVQRDSLGWIISYGLEFAGGDIRTEIEPDDVFPMPVVDQLAELTDGS
jgi:hypothetical protein